MTTGTRKDVKAVSPFAVQLADAAAAVDVRLGDILDRQITDGAPERLVAAMRHAALAGGKKFRPFLTLRCAALFDAPATSALTAAAAVELVHCYSLAHDDLPCMDNGELRRGQPTVWKAYDEWTAVLAGDALQALAFEVLSSPDCHANGAVRANLVAALALASGAAGMVGGQALDLEAEKRDASHRDDARDVARLQSMKTGRLIVAACEMGAIVGEAAPPERRSLMRYGQALGYAFQISDDLLDALGDTATVGKVTGKDAAANKATLVSLLGVTSARNELESAIEEAVASLAAFGDKARILADAARFMATRWH